MTEGADAWRKAIAAHHRQQRQRGRRRPQTYRPGMARISPTPANRKDSIMTETNDDIRTRNLLGERERIEKLLDACGLLITGTGFGMGEADIHYFNGDHEYQVTITADPHGTEGGHGG